MWYISSSIVGGVYLIALVLLWQRSPNKRLEVIISMATLILALIAIAVGLEALA